MTVARLDLDQVESREDLVEAIRAARRFEIDALRSLPPSWMPVGTWESLREARKAQIALAEEILDGLDERYEEAALVRNYERSESLLSANTRPRIERPSLWRGHVTIVVIRSNVSETDFVGSPRKRRYRQSAKRNRSSGRQNSPSRRSRFGRPNGAGCLPQSSGGRPARLTRRTPTLERCSARSAMDSAPQVMPRWGLMGGRCRCERHSARSPDR